MEQQLMIKLMESGLFDEYGNWIVEPPKGREQTRKEGGDLKQLVTHSLNAVEDESQELNENIHKVIEFKYGLDYESEEEWPIRYSTVFQIIEKVLEK